MEFVDAFLFLRLGIKFLHTVIKNEVSQYDKRAADKRADGNA